MTSTPPPPRRKRAPLKQRTTERMVRALDLDCEAVGEAQYRVWGGQVEHYVDLQDWPGQNACDCADYEMGSPVCKHIIRASWSHGVWVEVYRAAMAMAKERSHSRARSQS